MTDSDKLQPAGDPEDDPFVPLELPARPGRTDVVQRYSVSPRTVAAVTTIFAIACLATLSIVTAVRKADGLSTIALALAIIAFVVQILVFIAQSQSASQQMVQSEQLNTQSRSLLAEMQATARSTHAMVGAQFGDLLHAFTEAVSKTTGESTDGFDADAFEARLLENIKRMQASPAATSGDRARRAAVAPSAESARTRRLREVRAFTSGPFPREAEARPVLSDLQALSGSARMRLRELAFDRKRSADAHDYEGLSPSRESPGADGELQDKGMVKLVRLSEEEGPNGRVVYRLTDKGELASRVLTGTGQVPEWAQSLFVGVQDGAAGNVVTR